MRYVFGYAVAAFVVSACGEKVSETAEALRNIQSVASSAEQAQKSTDALTKRMEERRAKGDTLTIPYAELQKMLGDVSGWTGDAPGGESVAIPGASMSTASRVYRNGSKEMTVKLTDYNGNGFSYAALTGMFSLSLSTDNAEKSESTFRGANDFISGFQSYYKKEHRASVTWGLGGRFVLQIDASGVTSTDEVKAFAQHFNPEKLASM